VVLGTHLGDDSHQNTIGTDDKRGTMDASNSLPMNFFGPKRHRPVSQNGLYLPAMGMEGCISQ
jgi:hypothetical protein